MCRFFAPLVRIEHLILVPKSAFTHKTAIFIRWFQNKSANWKGKVEQGSVTMLGVKSAFGTWRPRSYFSASLLGMSRKYDSGSGILAQHAFTTTTNKQHSLQHTEKGDDVISVSFLIKMWWWRDNLTDLKRETKMDDNSVMSIYFMIYHFCFIKMYFPQNNKHKNK